MEAIAMDMAFTAMLVIGVGIKFLVPIAFVVIGIKTIKEGQKQKGWIMAIVGLVVELICIWSVIQNCKI